MTAALIRFIGSKKDREGRDFIKGVVIRKLYGDKPKRKAIDDAFVDELTQIAVVRALEAQTPPWTELGIRGWVRRVTRCAIADYFAGRAEDDEKLARDVDVESVGGEPHAEHPDWGAREHLIAKYLEGEIGDDAYKVETFRLMMENGVAGRSLDELSEEHDTTPTALSNRFLRLRKELAPRVSIMDREKPRRAILLALLAFGAAALVVLAVALWSWLTPAPPPRTILPAPSASAGPALVPSFDNALPTAPDSGPEPENRKPLPPR